LNGLADERYLWRSDVLLALILKGNTEGAANPFWLK
jgi:hypothetical protein